MFIRLGILNVRRQLTRSLLVIVTLALAAISLTYSLSYQHITPPVVAEFLGNFAGGEIMVAPLRWAGQQVSDVTGKSEYHYSRLAASGMSWMEWFYPELYSEGFWAKQGSAPSEFFSQADVQKLSEFPGIAAVAVTPLLPAVLETRDDDGVVYIPVQLTETNPRLSRFAYMEYPRDLPQLPPGGIQINVAMDQPKTTHPFQPDGPVKLWLPKANTLNGSQLDYAATTGVELPFANYLQVPTRTVTWYGGAPPSLLSEVGKFRKGMAWVDPGTWSILLQQAGVAGQLPVANLALRVTDPQQLDQVMAELGQAFPNLTFVNMGDVEQRMFSTGSLELFQQAPKAVYSISDRASLVVPASFNRIFGLLFMLIAGFLLGGHMLTNAAARHQEIGTLRALGARRRDILVLGICEAATTTFIGATSGFLVLRLFGATMELRGGQPFLTVLFRMLTEYGQVLGLSLVAALAFAIFPIWRLATLAPMEVLRNE